MIKEEKKIIIISILTILLIINFFGNIFAGKDEQMGEDFTFENFQHDSEYLVHSKIFADKYLEEKSKYGLFNVRKEDGYRFPALEEKIEYYKDSINRGIEIITIEDYNPQFGLQGHVFSFLHNKMHMPTWILKLICCILLGIVIIGICYCIYKKYNKLMAATFYATFLLSPWIVSFARNLYWVEFTWFLPALFGILLSLDYSKWKIYVPCIFGAILIKCLCGYEYISTIMLLTISFFIIDLFTAQNKTERIKILKTILIVGIACVLAFGVALCLHAILRGDGNILNGLSKIYKEDVVRRTIIAIGDVKNPEIMEKVAKATIPETVGLYFEWYTNIIFGINGQCFTFIFISAILIIIYNIISKQKDCYKEMVMYIVFLITTLSWLILGKSHSFFHTHMNYVLWYFGFIQICIYLITKFIFNICKKLE